MKLDRRGSKRVSLKSVDEEPPIEALPSKFGWTESDDFTETFFEVYSHLRGKVWVHHAVEQRMIRERGGTVEWQEIHSFENLRGIPLDINTEFHLSLIAIEWGRFYRRFGKTATRSQLLDFAGLIDKKYGHLFIP